MTALQAKERLLAIQKIYHDDRLYQLTKYHWLLLYECLETFSQGFNEQPAGWLTKKYGIQHIDFRTLVQLFFWDTSFLQDHLAKMSLQESRTMLIRHTILFTEARRKGRNEFRGTTQRLLSVP